MLEKCLEKVRDKKPLIHCITNYVTVNDVANSILACSASPIMSDEKEEASDITSVCNGLCINIGTLNTRSIEAMFAAGRKANEIGNVVLLDPVGAGASGLRTDTAKELTEKINFDVIRGNISEIKSLAYGNGTTRGVDADIADAVTEENLNQMMEFAKNFAKNSNTVVAITGKIDLVADANKCYVIRNGCQQMSRITGTGCMLSGISTAYAAANRDNMTEAVAAAVCVMGIAGQIGAAKMCNGDGNASLRNYIIDAIYNMDTDVFVKGAKYEIR